MAPSVGHLHKLVARNSKLFKAAWKKTQQLIRDKLPPSVRPSEAQLAPAYARTAPRHPLHRIAALKQAKGRWYSTHSFINATVRRFTTQARQSVKYDRASFPASSVRTAINRSTGRAPFASTLRPNLTGGTLGRTAGGYSVGGGRVGGARYFSHTPAAPAQVVQNVSQAVRAFLIGGQKAQFDGVNPRTGEKQWKAVSALQQEVGRKMMQVPKATPGSAIEFAVNPTITALTPLSTVAGFSGSAEKMTLNTEGFLDILTVDFSRALKELAAVLNDLKRLSALGDLPITYHDSALCVHFPGVDADAVERLCDELGVQRGFIRQDAGFDGFVGTEIALLFPFAPSKTPSEASFLAKKPAHERPMYQAPIDWRNMLTLEEDVISSPGFSTRSDLGHDYEDLYEDNPWRSASSPSAFESLHTSHARDSAISDACTPLEYQDFEGIYRFIEQCDNAARRN
ncbi:putative casein kinase ii beta 2 subunit protein [Neofusicoccum parvum UCRNP2]|uniref:Putative casein kinase ii beta 2 subunit protein n=1 Tax=Botryosphaeria parva (strain UCR-NP2) TaxID=1287680 RepID=R1GH15_BOTPV|nr:putative casein kinase ii beta 2 subunit protein [Neofusicoccum parvum UCRNP2]